MATLKLTENCVEWTDSDGQPFDLSFGTENTTVYASHGPGYDYHSVEIIIPNGDVENYWNMLWKL